MKTHPNENDIKILKEEHLNDYTLDYTQILDLSLDDQPYFTNP